MTLFSDFKLNNSILKSLADLKYGEPTPIQAQAIPFILQGKDFLGIAQTGTGKTAAFSLPILHLLNEEASSKQTILPRALILTPTRELAAQILTNLKRYGEHLPLRFAAIFGGVNEKPQIRDLKKGVDILVATPGRLMDLYHRKIFSLKGVHFCVLDEADRMLDMGFLPDVRKIMKVLSEDCQTLLFSATLPKEIENLVTEFLHDPAQVNITPPTKTADTVEQYLFFIPKAQKQEMLQHILVDKSCERVIVFSKTKFGAERIGRNLKKENIDNCTLHGDKSQKERQKALQHFRKGDVKVLVATDVASRGIDVSNISHVINFDLPDEPENYIHRIGRTGRAGKGGIAFSFCDALEKRLLRNIERKIQLQIPVISARKFWADFEPQKETPAVKSKKPRKKRSQFRKKRSV